MTSFTISKCATRFALAAALGALGLHAESGYDAWLRYQQLDPKFRQPIPAAITVVGETPLLRSARDELIRGVRGMLVRTLREESTLPRESAIVLGTLSDLGRAAPQWKLVAKLAPDGYWLKTVAGNTIVTATDDRGVLIGAFALLHKLALHEPISNLDEKQEPYAPIRWINQWDNLDGSIERGYGGRSIFWDRRRARTDLARVSDYARLLASLGINGCSINNVNADPEILSPQFIADAARIAEAFRPWGVRVVLSVDFGSPKSIGGLDTFDPLNPQVAAWWKAKIDELYRAIPDLAGLIVKADSEGRVGPSAYGRTHADAANVVARALNPHRGLLCYRGFVYDHHMDWQNPKNDRARAAFDNFKSLDGQFDDNVVIQIKNGPIDFQVREPASPLFATLEKTNQAIELQITQEYFGQARHTVFLAPMWKEVLDFAMPTPVKAFAAGKTFHRPTGGFIGVANVGLDDNWVGNHLSQANLYSFGRLAWNPNLTAHQIAEEWSRLTFSGDAQITAIIAGIQLSSWRTYEDYTGPLGLQTLTDITGNHYGVSVEASERNGWGQWHRADEKGVGMDRTVATGTGYVGQYPAPIERKYESIETCPDDLLLFMHHVPYTHTLHSGETVIQYIYDSHYRGAAAVAQFVRDWKSLKNRVDEPRYTGILAQLEYQAGQAQVWRDAVSNWFFRESGIQDTKDRVGHYPGRFEAESMTLRGYAVTDVTPWEAASGGKAIACSSAQCAATLRYNGEAGWYAIGVRYFDQNNGASRFQVFIRNQLIDEWTASERLPTSKLDGASSMRRNIAGIALRPGDEIRIEAWPDRGEAAAIDYIEIIHNP